MSTYEQTVLNARKQFLKLNKSQEIELLNLYKELAKQLQSDISSCRTTSQKTYLNNLHQIVELNIKDLNGELNKVIKANIETSSQIASTTELAYYQVLTDDVSLSAAFKGMVINTSHETVKKLIQGQFYKDKTSLDQRLWNITDKSMNDIDTLIKVNVLRGANAKELAKQVEKYVNPLKKLELNNDEVGFSKKVSYQATRLARTSITHSFRETQIQQAIDNPFNMGMKWELSPSHGVRMHGKTDICDDYATQNNYELGTGVFPVDKMPIGHPQCLCITYQVNTNIRSAMEELKAWTNGESNEKLDKWYEGVERTNEGESKSSNEQVKVNGKDGTMDIKVPKYKNNSDNKSNKKYNISKSNIIRNNSLKSNKIKYIPKESNINWTKHINVNEAQSDVLNQIHSELNEFIIKENREKVALFNKSDSKVYEQEGKLIDEVKLSKEIKKVLKSSPENSIIFIHNHNTPTPFSGSDIKHIIKYNAIEMMTLECADGTKYVLERGNAKSSFQNKLYFEATYDEIYNRIAEKYPDLNDEVKKYYVWDEFLDEVTREVAKQYSMIYKKVIE